MGGGSRGACTTVLGGVQGRLRGGLQERFGRTPTLRGRGEQKSWGSSWSACSNCQTPTIVESEKAPAVFFTLRTRIQGARVLLSFQAPARWSGRGNAECPGGAEGGSETSSGLGFKVLSTHAGVPETMISVYHHTLGYGVRLFDLPQVASRVSEWTNDDDGVARRNLCSLLWPLPAFQPTTAPLNPKPAPMAGSWSSSWLRLRSDAAGGARKYRLVSEPEAQVNRPKKADGRETGQHMKPSWL